MGDSGEERGVPVPLLKCFKTAFFHLGTWCQKWVLSGLVWMEECKILAAILPQFCKCGLVVVGGPLPGSQELVRPRSMHGKRIGKTLGFLPLWDSLMGLLLPLSLENMAVR